MSLAIVGLLLSMVVPAPPPEDLEDLNKSSTSRRNARIKRIVKRSINRTGVLVDVRQLDQYGIPKGPDLSDVLRKCRVGRRNCRPFDGRERDASQCGGYFVTPQLFLTAGHCLRGNIEGEVLQNLRVGRGYTSPGAKIKTYEIGLAVYSGNLEGGGKEEDWVLLEVCSTRTGCGSRIRVSRRVQRLRRALRSTTREGGERAGYLISSPLGFHLHVSSGKYGWGEMPHFALHDMPIWAESSGGPLFDQEDGSLVGIQRGILHGTGRQYCKGDTLYFMPSWKRDNGTYVPIVFIEQGLQEPVFFDPRNSQEREFFKRRLDAALQKRTGKPKIDASFSPEMVDAQECITCEDCAGGNAGGSKLSE